MRCAPASKMPSAVRFGHASTFTGFETASQTVRISSWLRSPGA